MFLFGDSFQFIMSGNCVQSFEKGTFDNVEGGKTEKMFNPTISVDTSKKTLNESVEENDHIHIVIYHADL